MARKTIHVSDKSGAVLDGADYAKVTVAFTDRRRGRLEAELTVDEATELVGKFATKRGVAGRPPKS